MDPDTWIFVFMISPNNMDPHNSPEEKEDVDSRGLGRSLEFDYRWRRASHYRLGRVGVGLVLWPYLPWKKFGSCRCFLEACRFFETIDVGYKNSRISTAELSPRHPDACCWQLRIGNLGITWWSDLKCAAVKDSPEIWVQKKSPGVTARKAWRARALTTQIVISAAENVAVVGYEKSSSYSGCMDVLCTGDGSNSDFKDFNSSAKTFRANFQRWRALYGGVWCSSCAAVAQNSQRGSRGTISFHHGLWPMPGREARIPGLSLARRSRHRTQRRFVTCRTCRTTGLLWPILGKWQPHGLRGANVSQSEMELCLWPKHVVDREWQN